MESALSGIYANSGKKCGPTQFHYFQVLHNIEINDMNDQITLERISHVLYI